MVFSKLKIKKQMQEVKDLYVVEWMGPYDSLEEMYDREGAEACCLYLITGRCAYERHIGIKYVGITKRAVYNRLEDSDHLEKQERIKDKQYWAGRFSVDSYNNLDTPSRRSRAESVETLLVRYLSNLPGAKMINERKRKNNPRKPIVLISRWQKKMTDDQRYNKPSVLSRLPDTLMYVDKEFYAGDKMRLTHIISTYAQ